MDAFTVLITRAKVPSLYEPFISLVTKRSMVEHLCESGTSFAKQLSPWIIHVSPFINQYAIDARLRKLSERFILIWATRLRLVSIHPYVPSSYNVCDAHHCPRYQSPRPLRSSNQAAPAQRNTLATSLSSKKS